MKKILLLERDEAILEAPGGGRCLQKKVMMIFFFRRWPIFGLLALSAGVLISCSSRGRAVHGTQASAIAEDIAGEEAAVMLNEVNRRRAAAGVGRLELDPALLQVAQRFAEDMAANGYFSHTSPSGQKLQDRLAAGNIRYSAAAENIAQADMDVRAVVEYWMSSPGHRANLLDPRMKRFGAGSSGDIWVQEFAD